MTRVAEAYATPRTANRQRRLLWPVIATVFSVGLCGWLLYRASTRAEQYHRLGKAVMNYQSQ